MTFFFLNSVMIAQQLLTKDDLIKMKQEAERMITEEFEPNLADIASDKNNSESKNIYIESVLYLFESTAKIKVSSSNASKVNSFALPTYLNRLSKISGKYNTVVMKFMPVKTDASQFTPKRDEKGKIYYECKMPINQCFCTSNKVSANRDIENQKRTYVECTYGDCTKKIVTVKLIQEPNSQGEQWIVKLSDIDVGETTPISVLEISATK